MEISYMASKAPERGWRRVRSATVFSALKRDHGDYSKPCPHREIHVTRTDRRWIGAHATVQGKVVKMEKRLPSRWLSFCEFFLVEINFSLACELDALTVRVATLLWAPVERWWDSVTQSRKRVRAQRQVLEGDIQ